MRHAYSVVGPSGLLASKGRLLCTNTINFVSECDELLMLRAGSVIERSESVSALRPNES